MITSGSDPGALKPSLADLEKTTDRSYCRHRASFAPLEHATAYSNCCNDVR
jgi:hypothetical protein